jgi:hypothetical protein
VCIAVRTLVHAMWASREKSCLLCLLLWAFNFRKTLGHLNVPLMWSRSNLRHKWESSLLWKISLTYWLLNLCFSFLIITQTALHAHYKVILLSSSNWLPGTHFYFIMVLRWPEVTWV